MSATPASVASPAWRVLNFEQVDSTNNIAGKQPPWHAIVARQQTRGRGRHGRVWVSDEGGLWLSAVLPTPGPAEAWSILPLAAGWALREALVGFGVRDLRLRWPNDLLVGPAKLAGILVERFQPDTAVVGLGLNHSNTPAAADPTLSGLVTRLADLVQPTPTRETVLMAVLAHLAVAQQRIAAGRSAEFLPALNTAWRPGRVAVTLHSSPTPLLGTFHGVTVQGHLRFAPDGGVERELPPSQVELLRELP
ncbi:MAG: biotin--[acetyl-CoA-carboxylase] ligase [Opitutae bacterium]|nr:biotin--[acetyl-CoA-carboxylase] ligase [Opitutae bacterium]